MGLSRETYRVIRRAARQNGVDFFPAKKVRLAPVHYSLNERAELMALVDGCIEGGKIGVARSGMDCDCSQYHRQFVTDYPGLVAFFRSEADHCESLDGPESTRYLHPSKVDRSANWSRDLAAEAFEEGHPHVVYAVSC